MRRVLPTPKAERVPQMRRRGLSACGAPTLPFGGRHAPILFPLIGRLREGCYLLGGKRFDAPTHGFCRDTAFAVERLSPTAVRFTTVDDAQTREAYPFAFSFSVEYALEGVRS